MVDARAHRSDPGLAAAPVTKVLNKSIRSKLIAGTLIILLSIVGLLTYVIAKSAAESLEEESQSQLSQLLDQSATILSTFMDANTATLELWASEPLVHSVANDPALGAIFSLGLSDYFDTHVSALPWVENIVLTKDQQVAYTHFDTPLSATFPQIAGALLDLSADGVAAFDQAAFLPDEPKGLIAIRRPLAHGPEGHDDAHILLLIDLDTVQQTLFSQLKTGKHGFLSLVAELDLPEQAGVWAPALAIGDDAEQDEFQRASDEGLLRTDFGDSYSSIMLGSRRLAESPLALVGVSALRDVREPVDKLIYFSIICGALAAVVGVASIFFLTGRITAPIRELTVKAHELAADHLASDVATSAPHGPAHGSALYSSPSGFGKFSGDDEVGELASVFHLLDKRTAELEQANALLEDRNHKIDNAMHALQDTQDKLVDNLDRLGRELAAARELQMGMVPSKFPAVSDQQPVDIYALMEPAREVGGDLYDFFYVDDDTLCFLLGDVADKGTSAALYMARTLSLVRLAVAQWREATGQIPSVEQIMRSVNRDLCQNNTSRMFVTLFLGLMDTKSGQVRFANAGHTIPYLLRKQGDAQPISDQRPNAPLGIDPRCAYRGLSVALTPGTTLILYSDGIPEAANPSGEHFAYRRLHHCLSILPSLRSKEAVMAIKSDVAEYVAGADASDDISLMALRWRPEG